MAAETKRKLPLRKRNLAIITGELTRVINASYSLEITPDILGRVILIDDGRSSEYIISGEIILTDKHTKKLSFLTIEGLARDIQRTGIKNIRVCWEVPEDREITEEDILRLRSREDIVEVTLVYHPVEENTVDSRTVTDYGSIGVKSLVQYDRIDTSHLKAIVATIDSNTLFHLEEDIHPPLLGEDISTIEDILADRISAVYDRPESIDLDIKDGKLVSFSLSDYDTTIRVRDYTIKEMAKYIRAYGLSSVKIEWPSPPQLPVSKRSGRYYYDGYIPDNVVDIDITRDIVSIQLSAGSIMYGG